METFQIQTYYSSTTSRNDTLSGRYQLEENLWTIRALRAYVYLNATITAAYMIALMIILFTNELYSRSTYYSLIEGFNAIYVYALALPLVLWYHRKDVKRQIRIAIRRDISTSANQVFKDLQSHWDSYTTEPKTKTSVAAVQYIDHR
ncbi:unnamed protein product [Cylicocyclus nassatus]|uniref:Uncharacterized protein n=1 Tax=Cylicocyclus nassatus TaxID=53992 RepID=A0AA36DK31_CYLNA|nr:unnamed protein product [Cylicocyclus nassatus]